MRRRDRVGEADGVGYLRFWGGGSRAWAGKGNRGSCLLFEVVWMIFRGEAWRW